MLYNSSTWQGSARSPGLTGQPSEKVCLLKTRQTEPEEQPPSLTAAFHVHIHMKNGITICRKIDRIGEELRKID